MVTLIEKNAQFGVNCYMLLVIGSAESRDHFICLTYSMNWLTNAGRVAAAIRIGGHPFSIGLRRAERRPVLYTIDEYQRFIKWRDPLNLITNNQ